MATLLLGAVGRAFLGPLGGILGTVVGGTVDRMILGGGRPREVGRIANPVVQTSSYGEPIPLVHGRMRVAGNLIWTTGLKESTQRSGGGKRGPATSTYQYSASFAVLLAGRAISGIGRVWADGRLIRNAAGEWLVPVVMRLHAGSMAQAPDPLIAAAEGAAPAYRGRAYAVFEDLPLADYGNRIPNLSFEIIADAGDAVDAGAAMADLAARAGVVLPVAGQFPAFIGLFTGRGGSVADVLAPLIQASGAAVAAGSALVGPGGGALAQLDVAEADARLPGDTRPRERQGRADAAPDGVELAYFDADRDYQPGLQRARRGTGSRVVAEGVAAVLAADAAKGLATTMLARTEAARTALTLRMPWRHLGLLPGDRVALADGSQWRISEVRFEAFVLSLDLVRVAAAGPARLAGDGGRPLPQDQAAAGPTSLIVYDAPPLPGELPASPRLWVAAAGAAPGWRRAAVEVSGDGGASWQLAGSASGPSVMGVALTALLPGQPWSWDAHGRVEVELLAEAMWLESRSRDALLGGANLALLGDELIQFADVEALGPRRFRLSGLLRGRRGTEHAMAGHGVGERFLLLDGAPLLAVTAPAEALGEVRLVRAAGVGDAGAPAISVGLGGEGLAPLAPVHLVATRSGGSLAARWVRRSRAGFGWPDFTDVPLAEDRELYLAELWQGGALVQSQSVAAAEAVFAGVGPGPATLKVAQIGATRGRFASLMID